MNNLGQMGMIVGIVMSIVGVLVGVILVASFFPIMQEEFDSLRGQNSLNCESTTNICDGVGSNDSDVCYNASVYHDHATTCAIQSIGLPLLLILLILAMLGGLVGTGYAMR